MSFRRSSTPCKEGINIPRLHNIKVHNHNFKRQKHTVEDVVLPRQRIQRNPIHELIEKQRRRHTRAHPREPLRPQPVRQDLRRIVRHQPRFDVVEHTITENDGDEPVAQRGLGRDLVACGDDGEDVEADEGADGRDEVDGATAQLVDQEGETQVLHEPEGFHAAVNTELGLRVCHTHIIHHMF